MTLTAGRTSTGKGRIRCRQCEAAQPLTAWQGLSLEALCELEGRENLTPEERRQARDEAFSRIASPKPGHGYPGIPDPSPSPREGYVYLVLFNDGTIKPGSTTALQRRLGEHKKDAQKFGIEVERFEYSPLLRDVDAAEQYLFEWTCAHAASPHHGEYFTTAGWGMVLDLFDQFFDIWYPWRIEPPEDLEQDLEVSLAFAAERHGWDPIWATYGREWIEERDPHEPIA